MTSAITIGGESACCAAAGVPLVCANRVSSCWIRSSKDLIRPARINATSDRTKLQIGTLNATTAISPKMRTSGSILPYPRNDRPISRPLMRMLYHNWGDPNSTEFAQAEAKLRTRRKLLSADDCSCVNRFTM